MGAELSRKRSGKKTRTGMSEAQLEDFASKSVGDVMGKSLIKAITKYLRKQETDADIQRRSLDAFSTQPLTPKEAAGRVDARRELERRQPSPPKRVVSSVAKQEDDYPPTKGERREAKRTKTKKMKVTGAGVKDLQQIIGRKGKGLGKQNVSEATAADPEASKRALNRQRVAATQSRPMPDPSTSSPAVVPGQERHSRPLPLAEEASHSPMGTRTRGYVAASNEGPAEYTPNGSIPRKASSRLKSTTARSPAMIQPSPNGKAEGIVAKAIDTYLKAEEYPPVDPKVIREGVKKIREARQGRRAKRNGHQPNSPTPSA